MATAYRLALPAYRAREIPMTQTAPFHSSDQIPVRHGFFGSTGGVSTGLYHSLNCGLGSDDHPALVRQNRAIACHSLGLLPDRLASVYQIHSADIITITQPAQLAERPRADGLVTNLPDTGLAILTADCTPVLLYDHKSGVIGACHAGWRGAATGVIENTIAAMTALGATPSTITALIGPTIAKPSYQTGSDMRQALLATAPHATRFFTTDKNAPEKYLFDLPAFAASCAARADIGQIINLGLDTYPANLTSDQTAFFSHRFATHQGWPDSGRQIAIITTKR